MNLKIRKFRLWSIIQVSLVVIFASAQAYGDETLTRIGEGSVIAINTTFEFTNQATTISMAGGASVFTYGDPHPRGKIICSISVTQSAAPYTLRPQTLVVREISPYGGPYELESVEKVELILSCGSLSANRRTYISPEDIKEAFAGWVTLSDLVPICVIENGWEEDRVNCRTGFLEYEPLSEF